MKNNTRYCLSFSLLAVCLVLITACDMPIGLGSLVNTEIPVIKNAHVGNQPGSYLRGADNPV
ncbi:MAG: hypothetical protein FWF26_05215, partial [Treponema sp.]|nr:hypothetical protein [Treponema sp.]